DGLAQPAKVALDAGGGHDQSAEFHASAATLAVFDVDFEAAHQELTPGAVSRAVGGWLGLRGAGRAVKVGGVGFSGWCRWRNDASSPLAGRREHAGVPDGVETRGWHCGSEP